ncbi:agamous-like MADS-box protein AGL80 [Malania oleifera]|uniref:agamous-like MADS-box protein AGL80 n=1 Tax=Malania oleifera TaxID=397392 RepID=UPI0025AE8095|nr:agamous-like MADS-box protein AGL80 [Malania oleifera]
MGRKKVRYELIADESARKVTFRKRKAGLLKKMSELKTLCGVDACAIIYDSRDDQPDAWPSSPEAHRVVEMFKDLPLSKQGKFMMDQESFLQKNISKLSATLEKEKKKNQRLKMEMLMSECLETKSLDGVKTMEDLIDLSAFLEEKKKLITKRIDFLKQSNPSQVTAGNEDKNSG